MPVKKSPEVMARRSVRSVASRGLRGLGRVHDHADRKLRAAKEGAHGLAAREHGLGYSRREAIVHALRRDHLGEGGIRREHAGQGGAELPHPESIDRKSRCARAESLHACRFDDRLDDRRARRWIVGEPFRRHLPHGHDILSFGSAESAESLDERQPRPLVVQHRRIDERVGRGAGACACSLDDRRQDETDGNEHDQRHRDRQHPLARPISTKDERPIGREVCPAFAAHRWNRSASLELMLAAPAADVDSHARAHEGDREKDHAEEDRRESDDAERFEHELCRHAGSPNCVWFWPRRAVQALDSARVARILRTWATNSPPQTS